MRPSSEQTKLPALTSTLVGLSIVVSIASYFRLHRLSELLIFATDQGRAMLAGRNILLGQIQLIGPPTSVDGFHLGPLYYYFTAFALALSRFDPIGPAIMTALFGVIGSAVLFLFIKNYYGSTTGLLAGLFFALSPLAATQSRIAIEPSPLPTVTVIWLYCLTRLIETRTQVWLIFTIGLLLMAVQLNFSAIVMVPIMILAWILTDSHTAPARKQAIIWSGGLLLTSLQLYKSLLGPQTDPTYLVRIWQELTTPGLWLPAIVLFTIALLGLWLMINDANRKQASSIVLMCWLIISSWSFLLKNTSGDHSLALLFMAPAMLIAFGLSEWLKRARVIGWLLLIPLVLLLARGSAAYVFDRSTLTKTDHQIIVDKIIQLSWKQPYNFLYRGHLDVYDAADDHYQYLLWLSGHPPVESARINLEEKYIEQWLLKRGFAEKTIILYYPAEEAQRYPAIGDRQSFNGVILETIDQ